ncbi:LPS export ABC transporter periplasmic protein LptC [Allosphingosinicella deserti]|uniref:LPS export ABC transporter periplasmic protein LptC n=1 Tax=Allosphingosinicella deserti TaxID=2116704 RepID=A0A2P7QGI3_9SPHN|nr:LPS export ABC transporter periplasmic protein LptC [Sphingomonas deserti]PSJ37053.1 LPS export ABC transporter periplasmic protein LptC [Sphingomonas deserti]
MPEAGDQVKVVKRSWAAPGGLHDVLVKALKVLLPAGIGVLLAYLLLSPLSKDREISFLLDKNKVDVAGERLKVQSAQYRGQDDQGRPFTINAKRALQASSKDPFVDIDGMSAGIQLSDGPARIAAPKARYNMDAQKVDVLGPILVTAADGYRLETRDVRVDLNQHKVESNRGVEGQMPLGRFTAAEMQADLPSRTVVLKGRARLHIVQGGLR